MRKQDYFPLVERIRSKINNWTCRFLSYAGRLQLIKVVLMNIVNLWAAVFRLLSKCMKEVEQLCASFHWSGPELKSRGAKVTWRGIFVNSKMKVAWGLELSNKLIWSME